MPLSIFGWKTVPVPFSLVHLFFVAKKSPQAVQQ